METNTSTPVETFLHRVAQRITTDYPEGMERVAVVFNNWRSGLFLKEEFLHMEREVFFLPVMMGMDELVGRFTDLRVVQPEFLLFELYKIHRGLNPTTTERFEDFFSTAEMMLRDFSEVDLYEADAERLFGNLYDIKKIGEWDISGESLSEFQQRYLDFYKSLYQYYTRLRQSLADQGIAYSGMAYRDAVTNLERRMQELPYEHIYFVGFNVMSQCENDIINTFVKQGRGSLIVDGDHYYYDNTDQEAGLFLRKRCKQFGKDIVDLQSNYQDLERDITIVPCPSDIAQTKQAGQILSQLTPDSARTAVVLADESLLPAMLNALPDAYSAVNVTMGYPFELTGIHTLAMALLSMHLNRRESGQPGGPRFYHRDVQRVLSSPLVAQVLESPELISCYTSHQAKSPITYPTFDDINTELTAQAVEPIRFLFAPAMSTPTDFLHSLVQLASLIAQHTPIATDETDSYDRQWAQQQEEVMAFYRIVTYLLQLPTELMGNLNILNKLYTKLARRHKVTFRGEPLEGLQVLGMLETRNIDFDNILLLSTGEGILPAGHKGESLIPLDLKREHGLPTYRQKDAIFAYHFYCMLQRARKIYLCYNTDPASAGKGEASRFILQFEKELQPCYNGKITIHHRQVNLTDVLAESHPTDCVEKSDAVMERLRQMVGKGLSPTSLSVYLNCPRQFYYQYVLNAWNPDDVEDDLQSNEIGDVAHHVLQTIFAVPDGASSPRKITMQDLDVAMHRLPELTEKAMKETLKGRELTGRNHLYYEIILSMLRNFIRQQEELIASQTLVIIGVEKELKRDLDDILSGNEKLTVKIGGKADRIDRLIDSKSNSYIRIVDYKTGRVDKSEVQCKFNENGTPDENFDTSKLPNKWLQVMIYAWLYAQDQPDAQEIRSGFYPLRDPRAVFVSASVKETNGVRESFNKQWLGDNIAPLLCGICTEMLNPDIPFETRSTAKTCSYCYMQRLCPKSKASLS